MRMYIDCVCDNFLPDLILISFRTMVPIYLDHIPSGTSTRPLVHYAQLSLLNREFKKYDFGNADENIEHYGVPVPPNHDMTNVQV